MTDDYPTCEKTYVTLRVYHDSADPSQISSALGIEATDQQRRGESYERRGVSRTYPLSGWFLRSKDHVESYDSAKHLDWLLQQLQPHRETLKELHSQGWRMDIACFWDSHSGHGGPDLLQRLAAMGIELWFDVYFLGTFLEIQKTKESRAARPDA